MFLILGASACIGFAYGILSEDNFMILAVSAFSFYFSNKGETSAVYAGK